MSRSGLLLLALASLGAACGPDPRNTFTFDLSRHNSGEVPLRIPNSDVVMLLTLDLSKQHQQVTFGDGSNFRAVHTRTGCARPPETIPQGASGPGVTWEGIFGAGGYYAREVPAPKDVAHVRQLILTVEALPASDPSDRSKRISSCVGYRSGGRWHEGVEVALDAAIGAKTTFSLPVGKEGVDALVAVAGPLLLVHSLSFEIGP